MRRDCRPRVARVQFKKKSWCTHIDYLIRIANSRLYAIRLLKSLLSESDLLKLYNSTVRCILEYGSPLLLSISNSECEKLEKVQSRFHKILHPNCTLDSCLPTLLERRKTTSVKMFYNAFHNVEHTLHSIIPDKGKNLFLIPKCKSAKRFKTFIPATSSIVNSYYTR